MTARNRPTVIRVSDTGDLEVTCPEHGVLATCSLEDADAANARVRAHDNSHAPSYDVSVDPMDALGCDSCQ